MSDVQFDEGGGYSPQYEIANDEGSKGLVGLVMKTGIAKTVGQANLVLVVILILAICISAYVVLFSGSKPKKLTPVEIRKVKAMPVAPHLQ